MRGRVEREKEEREGGSEGETKSPMLNTLDTEISIC